MVEKVDKIGTGLLHGCVDTREIEGGKIRWVDILSEQSVVNLTKCWFKKMYPKLRSHIAVAPSSEQTDVL